MKMSKTIIPALAMLVVSAVMLTTASLAWFAMSERVTANGMTVNIKSDSRYLLILPVSGDNRATEEYTAQDVQQYGSTSATGVAIGSTDVYPSAYYNDILMGKNAEGERDKKVTLGSQLKDASYWYTATAASPEESAMIQGSDITLKDVFEDVNNANKGETAFDGYVVRYRYYVVLAAGSNAMQTLRIESLTITDATNADGEILDPVRVVVACGDQMEEFTQTKAGAIDLTGTNNLTDTTALEICIYVYYDGNDDSVTTNDVASLSSANIEFILKAETPVETN